MEEKKTTANESKLSGFFKGVKSEFQKIVWPTKELLAKQTVAVVVITVITSVLIALVDRGLQYGINFIVK